MSRKIAIIADVRDWAFGSVARHIKKTSELSVEVYYSDDFENVEALARFLLPQKFDVIHFLWRLYFERFIDCLKKNHAYDDLAECRFSFSVPDYGCLSQEFDLINQSIFHQASGVVFTNPQLQEIYTHRYSQEPIYRVIYDPVSSQSASEASEQDGTIRNSPIKLRCLWVGNGSWKGAGNIPDYKGFTSIWSELKNLLADRDQYTFNEIDSSVSRRPHSEVLEAYKKYDVLCMTSLFEGTSLPVIEAMANGLAVVTTNTGVFPHICSETSAKMIARRNARSFATRLQSLHSDPSLLYTIKSENLESMTNYQKQLAGVGWDDFFLAIIGQSGIHSRQKLYRKPTELRRSNLTLRDEATPVVDAVALTSSKWLGVRNSTRVLFDRTIEVPLAGNTNIEREGKLVREEINESRQPIVISGGDDDHRKIFDSNKAIFKLRNCTLLWHGSITQWNDLHHFTSIGFWIDRYYAGEIKGIACFKEDLSVLLKDAGINTFLLKNFIPRTFNSAHLIPNTTDLKPDLQRPLNIGLFSASSNDLKNLATQIFAAKLSATNTRLLISEAGEHLPLMRRFSIPFSEVGRTLTQEELCRTMEMSDLALYVTFTECSPMVPMEAVHAGVPCIVSRASNIYAGHPELEDLLVVERPDDAKEIALAIDECIANYEVLLGYLSKFQRSHWVRQKDLVVRYQEWLED